MRSGKKLRKGIRKLIKAFPRGQANVAQTTRASAAAPSGPAQMNHKLQQALAHAARGGINATRTNLNEKILGEKHTTQDVLRLLAGGDTGIRRAATAAENIKSQFKPQQLAPEDLNGAPQQWAQQSQNISQMASQIGTARFSEDLNGRFLDYGTSGTANPFNAVAEHHPQQDHPVRNWLANGVGLLSDLLSAQERALDGQPPLSESEIADLKERVDNFVNPGKASPPATLEMEGFAEEVMQAIDEKIPKEP